MEEAYDFCDRKPFVWSAEAGQKFADKCEALLAHYSWLAKDSMKQGTCMFSIVQKHHLFAHYPSQCRYLAPRGCWANGWESFMSLIVAIASGSVKSTPAWMLPIKALNTFQFAFHLVLKGIWDPGMEEEGEGREWKQLMNFSWYFGWVVAGKPWALGGRWLGSHNFHTIVFCTAFGEWWRESHGLWVGGGWTPTIFIVKLNSVWTAIAFAEAGWTATAST